MKFAELEWERAGGGRVERWTKLVRRSDGGVARVWQATQSHERGPFFLAYKHPHVPWPRRHADDWQYGTLDGLDVVDLAVLLLDYEPVTPEGSDAPAP